MDEATKKLLSGHVRIEDIDEIPARTVRVFLNSAGVGKPWLDNAERMSKVRVHVGIFLITKYPDYLKIIYECYNKC